MTTHHLHPESRLRPVTAALGVLRAYGGTPPEPLRQAHETIREARLLATEFRVWDPIAYARDVVAADDRPKALAAAAKRRAADRDRAEIAAALAEAAVENAVSTFHKHADEIADAILASERLAGAFADVERAVAGVPVSALAHPNPDDLDTLAAVAVLRRAVVPFERVLVSLTATGLVSEHALPGAAHLLYVDPTEADREAVRRALKGVRPGVPDVAVWSVSAATAPAARPFAEPGVPAAILAHTPGVVLRQPVSLADLEHRVAYVTAAPEPVMTESGDASGWVV